MFFVDPVSFAICELLSSVGYLFNNQRIAYGFSCLKERGVYFVSFFDINNDVSYCKGWRTGENILDGKKWDIKITKDEWDELWFDYDYYGTSNDIEYTITYKYEVIDSLLHFSNTEGQEFIFYPSDKEYSKDIDLLISQTKRCSEILKKISKKQIEEDKFLSLINF